jgi:ABC-2 type transport system permease protein
MTHSLPQPSKPSCVSPAEQVPSEPGRLPWWREAAALWAFGLREYRIWQSYRVNQVMQITNLFVTTLLFFLLGKTIAGQTEQRLGPAYGTNYRLVRGGRRQGQRLHQHQSRRSFHPHPAQLLQRHHGSVPPQPDDHPYAPLGMMTKFTIADYRRLFVTFGFGMRLFGAPFNFAGWPLAFGFTALFLAAGFGLGMLSASSFYLLDIKKGTEPVQIVVQHILATLLAGTYYPTTVLPRPLEWVACLIPHS